VHGLDNAAKFSDLCISCGLCKEICPADIDMPMMISKVKNQTLENNPQPLANKILMASEILAKLACATAPISNWVLRSSIGKVLNEKLLGIDRQRILPNFKRRTFKKRFKPSSQKESESKGNVAFFVDYFANYISPELAISATDLLEKAQIKIELPRQKTSGYPYISYGELEKAKKTAEFNVAQFLPYIKEDFALVTIEPTAAYAFKQVYPKLLDNSEESMRVAEKTFEFFEYLAKLMEEGKLLLPPQIKETRTFGFHIPCHQRAGSSGNPTLKILQSIGFDVQIVETGTCCGMAGTFGLKQGPLGYDLSTTVGQPLFDLFKATEVDAIITESSVCKMQLEDGTGLKVVHPLELITTI
jgi:Fe-S oxidoreductase